MLLLSEKKQKEKELETYGIAVEDIHLKQKYNRPLLCLFKGLLVFLAAYGTIDGVLSAFSINYNRSVIVPFLLVISLFLSFLYLHKVLFYIGYVILLITFTIELVKYNLFANSGYQAIINILYEEYSDYFNLASIRESQEFYDNRYLTVTIALVFIGIFLALLLNVTISGYMNAIETVLITAPFIEIALYIGKKPSQLSILCLLFVYITVFLLQCSGNSRMQVKGRKTKELLRLRRKNYNMFFYQGNATGMIYSSVIAAVTSAIIITCLSPMYQAETVDTVNSTAFRKTTDKYISIFLQTGFTGLLDRYSSNGGLSSGRLGGVSSVRPDFETDLNVTLVPYSTDTIYLKGFTGNFYGGDSWYEHFGSAVSETDNTYYYDSENRIAYEKELQQYADATAKIEILNMDADTAFVYQPYYPIDYSLKDTGNSSALFPTNSTLTVNYHPYLGLPTNKQTLVVDEAYEQYLNETCLLVPESLQSDLFDWCVQAKLPGIMGTFQDGTEAFETSTDYRLSVAAKIKEYFYQNYPYTMSPGSTPYNHDFVDYFLFTQQRGYCAHFASSAAVILRTMEIPARYAEGYCIPLSEVTDGTPMIAENYDDWYEGTNLLSDYLTDENSQLGVVNVNISDAYAHAWVEIYLEDYGWIPYEFTPPSFEEQSQGSSILSDLINSLFNITMPQGLEELTTNDTEIEMDDPNTGDKLSFSFSGLMRPLIILLSSIGVLLLLYFSFRLIIQHLKIQRMLKNEEYAELVSFYYLKTLKFWERNGLSPTKHPMPEDLLSSLDVAYPSVNNREFLEKTEKICFDTEKISKEELDNYVNQCKQYKKTYKKK